MKSVVFGIIIIAIISIALVALAVIYLVETIFSFHLTFWQAFLIIIVLKFIFSSEFLKFTRKE